MIEQIPGINEPSGFIIKIDGVEMRIATGRGPGLNMFYEIPLNKTPPRAHLLGYAKGTIIEIVETDIVLSGLYSFFLLSFNKSSPLIGYRKETQTNGNAVNTFISLA